MEVFLKNKTDIIAKISQKQRATVAHKYNHLLVIALIIVVVFTTNISCLSGQNSTFSGTRLENAIVSYLNSTVKGNKEISIIQSIPDFQFQEKNVEANINDEQSILKGNTSVKLEFFSNNKLIRSYNVPIYVKTFVYSVITSTTLKTGHTLAASDIQISKIESTNLNENNLITFSSAGASQELATLLGKTINKNIIRGQIVFANDVDSENTVKRGTKVIVLAKQGFVTVRGIGTALSDAKVGEFVRVQRDGSKTNLVGIVAENQIVVLK